MADPASLAAISLGTSIAGGASSGLGAILGGGAQSSMYKFQAAIAAQNEMIDKQNAQYALQQGENQAAQSGMAQRFRIGEIKAAQGASGLQVGKGTAPQVVSGQREIAQTDQAILRSNAAKSAYDFDIGSIQAAEQVGADKAAAANVQAAEPLNVASSFLGTAAGVSSKWLQYTQTGTIGNG